MRQRRWLELLSDYDCDIRYHPGKENVVADALSRKERIEPLRVRALVMTIGLNLPKRILEAQIEAQKPENLVNEDVGGMIIKDKPPRENWNHESMELYVKWQEILTSLGDCGSTTKFGSLLPIRENEPLDKMAKALPWIIVARHGIPASIIYDCDGRFTSNFWKSFQKALGTNISMSTSYHPETDGQSERTIQTLEDMLRACVIYFGKVCWTEDGEAQLTGLELIQKTTEKIILIKQRMQAAQDRQKSYANKKQKPMEYKAGDRVMLKFLPWKGVVRFGKRGKLNPRYVGPFKADEPLVMPLEGIHVDDKLQFVEEPVEIIEREIKRLNRSQIPLVKVRWNFRIGPEFN
ncbi:putative reverse transcriptase domain-containing protein [Tanacetum coccineum]